MAGSGSSEVRIPIFSGENYEFWRIKMATIFKSLGLWSLVEKGISTPDSKKKTMKVEESSEEEADAEMFAVLMKDAKALGIIQNAVSDQIFLGLQMLTHLKSHGIYSTVSTTVVIRSDL
ncbi:hypothetical protein L3X38_012012 [Prunus dulcis]|uniref:DUF4219 domain-containing protein n=1 Tax=Prunus dulcis TaxID=3755 RepID=A0AAD4WIH3_PRUDU|nr:hypothetical protein L3X38_012012 [Prunus dulcis]